MKTCRFCNNQQESGDRCDACGSPFSADKVDFSEGFPDLTGGESAFPDPTIPQIPDPTVPVAPVPVDASPAEDTPAAEKVPVPEETAEATEVAAGVPETPEDKPADAPVETAPERKVIYSAAASGETVYQRSKGGYHPNAAPEAFKPSLSTSDDAPKEQAGPGWWNGAPNASSSTADSASGPSVPDPEKIVAAASVPKQDPKSAAASYKKTYIHSLITFILSAVGLLCCCGMSTPSLVLSLIAFLKVKPLNDGLQVRDPEKAVNSAKIMTDIADILLFVAAVIMGIVIFVF